MFFTSTPTTEIYTLSLHDALPISFGKEFIEFPLFTKKMMSRIPKTGKVFDAPQCIGELRYTDKSAMATETDRLKRDRKSTRLNSSHRCSSYAVFCLKKKKPHNCRY